jgi:hypothetical protein
MSKHIIHIGSNRAASTSLQKNLFNKIESFYHIGLNSKLNFECKNNFKKLISSRTQYNFNNPLKKKIDQLKKKKKKLLISSEDICSSPAMDLCSFRLSKLVPDAEILIVIRNQFHALNSWYNFTGHLFKFGPKQVYKKKILFNDWIKYIYDFKDYNTTPLQLSPISAMNYNEILSVFEKNFPNSKVHILFYEDMIFEKEISMQKLSKILNLEKNFVREFFFNSFMFNYTSKKNNLIKKKYRDLLFKYFAKSNRILEKKYKLDFKRYNYPI